MVSKLIDYILEKQLLAPSERIILAVSGGMDSMVLVDLMRQLGGEIAIAHCNFRLRGAESDADEALVRKKAAQLNIPFFCTFFNTEEEAAKHGKSIQETARDLRYNWFHTLLAQHNYQKIATAHHLNDSIETVLFNFSRGTGIRGLDGIPVQNGAVIRPLLFATRKEIANYAKKHHIEWREDHSNSSLKYARNLIRHKIIPVFEALNPNFVQSAVDTIDRIGDYEALVDFAFAKAKQDLLREVAPNKYRITIEQLLTYPALPTLCFQLLRPFGYHREQIRQLINSLNGKHVGRQLKTDTWVLLIDREELLLEEKTILHEATHQIYEDDQHIRLPDGILHVRFRQRAPRQFSKAKNIAYLNVDRLDFPLTIRHWVSGDYFFPLGMNKQRKKLQDFFTDQKLDRFAKSKVWLICSGKKIVWVVNHRIDHRFRIREMSAPCLELEFVPSPTE